LGFERIERDYVANRLKNPSWRGTKLHILSEPGFVGFKDVPDVGTTLSAHVMARYEAAYIV